MAISYGIPALLFGLSTDTKPTNVPAKSVFIETDLRGIYIYNGTTWQLISSSGDVSGFLQFLAQASARFTDADSSNYVEIKAPSVVSSNRNYTLPPEAPVADSLWRSNASGVMSVIRNSWSELGRASATGGSTSVSVSSFAAKKILEVDMIVLAQTSGMDLAIRFNGDTGGNYDVESIALDTTPVSVEVGGLTSINASNLIANTTSPVTIHLRIVNISNKNKVAFISYAAEGDSPVIIRANWTNVAAQITSIELLRNPLDSTGTFTADTEVVVYGRD